MIISSFKNSKKKNYYFKRKIFCILQAWREEVLVCVQNSFHWLVTVDRSTRCKRGRANEIRTEQCMVLCFLFKLAVVFVKVCLWRKFDLNGYIDFFRFFVCLILVTKNYRYTKLQLFNCDLPHAVLGPMSKKWSLEVTNPIKSKKMWTSFFLEVI